MAREVEANKAKETIFKLFNQSNLSNERLEIIKGLIQSMVEPVKEDNQLEKVKYELKLYKENGGVALKAFVQNELKKISSI